MSQAIKDLVRRMLVKARAQATSIDKSNDDNDYEVQSIEYLSGARGEEIFTVHWRGYDETSVLPRSSLLQCSYLLEEYDAKMDGRAPCYPSGGVAPCGVFAHQLLRQQQSAFDEAVRRGIVSNHVVRFLHNKHRLRVQRVNTEGRIGQSISAGQIDRYLKDGGPGVLVDHRLYDTKSSNRVGPYHTVLLYRRSSVIYLYDASIRKRDFHDAISRNGLINAIFRRLSTHSPSCRVLQLVGTHKSRYPTNCFLGCLSHMTHVHSRDNLVDSSWNVHLINHKSK
ncbi:hypothetical protein SNEBB_009346 [Seison nebaliae]|nr:hypothetical protein SNEBB_009346 [Seison nebaliae]